jgi:hypothetical protein
VSVAKWTSRVVVGNFRDQARPKCVRLLARRAGGSAGVETGWTRQASEVYRQVSGGQGSRVGGRPVPCTIDERPSDQSEMCKLSQFAVIVGFVGSVVDSLGLLPVSTSLGSEINALTLLKQTPQEPQTPPSSHDLDQYYSDYLATAIAVRPPSMPEVRTC